MKIRNVNLETVCGITSTFPDNDYPEIAFAGKSNVGKSSLINVLMNRKALARTSAQPGKTQTVNYYRIDAIGDQPEESGETKKYDMYFVDLPGYGYAKASATSVEQWGKMIERYLNTSRQLKAVFLLIDIRHEPSANDRTMYDWILHNGYHPIIIATKSDKINRSQLAKQIKMIKNSLSAESGTIIIPFSATSKQGRDDIYETIDKVLEDRT